jgi:uncharacterized SAM-binding protein YcdF (DUF218 family)
MHLGLRLFLVVAVLAAEGGLLTLGLFVWPPTGRLASADAVVVLSGDHGERLARALQLIHSGVSDVLVYAGAPDTQGVRDLCRGGQSFEVVCVQPDPDNTRDEARATADLAVERSWRTLLVVSSTQHVTRAGLLFRRCVKGTVAIVPAQPRFGLEVRARVIVHEWLALGYALTLARGC